MRVLVINCGSSSLRAEVLDAATGERIASRKVERIAAGDHAAALEALLPELLAGAAAAIDVVAHRVVHGGERFTRPTPIDDELEAALEARDRAREARREIERTGLMFVSKSGTPHLNPLAKVERDSMREFRLGWKQLNLDVSAPEADQ